MGLAKAFDFEIDEGVVDNFEFLNGIFTNLNEPPILENPNFELKNSSCSYAIEIVAKSATNSNSVEIWLEVGSNHIRLDLNGIAETFEWVNIKDSKKKVADFLQHIFTGHILIESSGRSRSVQIFDSEGQLFHSLSYNSWFHMLTGLHVWRRNTHKQLFSPFLSDEKSILRSNDPT